MACRCGHLEHEHHDSPGYTACMECKCDVFVEINPDEPFDAEEWDG